MAAPMLTASSGLTERLIAWLEALLDEFLNGRHADRAADHQDIADDRYRRGIAVFHGFLNRDAATVEQIAS
jgi:hypothetical protein